MFTGEVYLINHVRGSGRISRRSNARLRRASQRNLESAEVPATLLIRVIPSHGISSCSAACEHVKTARFSRLTGLIQSTVDVILVLCPSIGDCPCEDCLGLVVPDEVLTF